MNINLLEAIKLYPHVVEYMSLPYRLEARKAVPLSRDELERRLARVVLGVERKYLAIIENSDGILPFDFWQNYERDMREAIASPLRQQIEQSFASSSDYTNFIDKAGAVGDIDTAMTRAIDEVSQGISKNARARYEAMIQKGIRPDEIIERMALQFSSGHAEQIAVTELTRAEAQFSEALSARLSEQGVESQIRWLTSEDEISQACPICNPLDQKLKQNGGWMTKSGMITSPPAHPNCRCQTVVELQKRKPAQ